MTGGGGHELAIGAAGATGRKFLIHSCLGRGGFGEVYRATMTSAGGVRTEVAIKILRADIDPGSDSVKRLRDEGRLLGALSHPAILKVHDLVLLEGRVALVTEFVEGEDLDSCLASDPPMPVRALVGVVGEVGAALDVAWNAPSPQVVAGSSGHRSGEPMHLVHRDVKPANIRLGRHGEVKLLDFGIARATNLDREAHTANNAMLGSYLYMAPERFHEEKVEPPSDVYALGCVLFEGLTRHRLFDGMTLKQIYGVMLLSRKYNSHLEERLRLVPDTTPPQVMELLRSLLDVDPSMRPTAGQLARMCEDLSESLSGLSLKRWARAREWPPQPHIQGSLDGRELSAESFDVSMGEPPIRSRAEPGAAEPSLEPVRPVPPPPGPPSEGIPTGLPVLAGVVGEEDPSARAPSAEAQPSAPPPRPAPEEVLPFAGLIPLPGPGESALDAPIAGIASREMVRPSPEELEKLRREAEDTPPPVTVRVPNAMVSVPPPRPSPGAMTAPASMAGTVYLPPKPASQGPTGETAAGEGTAPPVEERPAEVRTEARPEAQPEAPSSEGSAEPEHAKFEATPPEPVQQAEVSYEETGKMPVVAPSPVPGVDTGITDSWFLENTPAPLPAAPPRPRAQPVAIPVKAPVLPPPGPQIPPSEVLQAEVPHAPEPIPGVFDTPGAPREREVVRSRRADAGRRQRAALWAVIGMTALGLVLVAALGVWVAVELTQRLEPPLPAEGLTPQVRPPSEPVPSAPLPPAPAQTAPAPPAPTQAEPAPEPAPAPAPRPQPARVNVKSLIQKGWNKMERDPRGALALFEQVIAADPRSSEGWYGKGYALAELSRNNEAVKALCKGISLASSKDANEIRQIMEKRGLGRCP